MGTGMQSGRFKFSWETANEVQTSVIPVGDIVPKVDLQLGQMQKIVSMEPCGPKNAMCHSMALTMRTLATNCGDPLGRMASRKGCPAPYTSTATP